MDSAAIRDPNHRSARNMYMNGTEILTYWTTVNLRNLSICLLNTVYGASSEHQKITNSQQLYRQACQQQLYYPRQLLNPQHRWIPRIPVRRQQGQLVPLFCRWKLKAYFTRTTARPFHSRRSIGDPVRICPIHDWRIW